jgi:hypothetical protein
VNAVTTADLLGVLEPTVGRIARLDRRPSAYSSSFAIEDLDVQLADGRLLALVFKNVGRDGLLPGARSVKPEFLRDPRREIEVYRCVLGPDVGARYFASVTDDAAGRYWLFLERVTGVELYQVGDIETWQAVARWLARFHARFAADAPRLADEAHLLRHDAAFYQRWPQRARDVLAVKLGIGRETRERFNRMVSHYGAVVEQLVALPVTVIHGEFYASNVLVDGSRVCPVDWEMAALGPGLIDLAALTAGKWTDCEKAALVQAYEDSLTPDALDWCRLHLAVQWLGWSAEWTPPAGHAQDWLGEALRLADVLGLT